MFSSRPGPSGTFRGVQVTPGVKSHDLDALAGTGCNLIRYQYRKDFDADNSNLITTLDHARRLRMRVAICLMHQADNPFESWSSITQAVVGNGLQSQVYGYDILNEPPMTPGVWNPLAREIRATVRRYDKKTAIILSGTYGDPTNLRYLDPLNDRNVIHTFHHYHPFAYTHQGVYSQYPMPRARPNKERLKAHLERVRAWQQKHGARIYVGEFSTARWSPEGATYLRDCLDIFESYKWDWTYHAWREWEGWSLEHSDTKEYTAPVLSTSRKRVIFRYLSRSR